MNYTKPQEINDAFKGVDNATLWTLSKQIANAFKAQTKELNGLQQTVAKAQTTEEVGDMTDEEISLGMRRFFTTKLREGTLIAGEINAFKDILGLLDKEQSIVIQTVNYADLTDEDIEAAKAG